MRPALKWFFWLSCVLAAFFCTRTARADAPMCDARGMSIDAPPPVTPIRDARIERTPVLLCRDQAARLGVRQQVSRGATAVADGAAIESWITTKSTSLPTLTDERAVFFSGGGLMKAPGHDAGVFRPPRAA
jgi:hypothetical protein